MFIYFYCSNNKKNENEKNKENKILKDFDILIKNKIRNGECKVSCRENNLVVK